MNLIPYLLIIGSVAGILNSIITICLFMTIFTDSDGWVRFAFLILIVTSICITGCSLTLFIYMTT